MRVIDYIFIGIHVCSPPTYEYRKIVCFCRVVKLYKDEKEDVNVKHLLKAGVFFIAKI